MISKLRHREVRRLVHSHQAWDVSSGMIPEPRLLSDPFHETWQVLCICETGVLDSVFLPTPSLTASGCEV